MHPFLLQDWVTIQAGVNNASITQSEPSWLDMSEYLDLVAWLEVKQVSTSSGNVALAYQTCPSKDDSLFQNMNDTTVAMAAGVQVAVLLRDTALCPLTRWLRWQLLATAAATWQATFRIWVSASQPGGYALEDLMADNAAYGGGPDYVQLVGGDSGSSAPTTGTIPQHIAQQTALQHKGPAPLAPRNIAQTSSLGHGVQMRHMGYSPTVSPVGSPRFHGWMGIPTYNPSWKRNYIMPVVGAFQNVFPLNPGDPEIKK